MQLKFVNREYELDNQICKPGQPALMVIDAPAGYGKTVLLEEVNRRYEKDNWKCALVRLERCKSKSAIRHEITDQIGAQRIEIDDDQEADAELRSVLGEAGKVILLFDSVERADKEDLNWLRTELVPNCKKGLSGLQFRAIFAGRYTHAEENVSKWLDYKHIELSPFTQDVVRGVIEDAVKQCEELKERELTREHYVNWARHVMHLSGGHPKSIQELVNKLKERNWTPSFSAAEERRLFEECVAPHVEEITSSLDDTTKKSLEILSIFRYFTLNTVQALQQRGRLLKEIDPLKILARSVKLVAKTKSSPFYSGEIVRNFILARMRIFEPDRYQELNRIAQEIYDTWIDSLLSMPYPYPYPFPFSRQDLVPMFVRESIYHCCQQLPATGAISKLAMCLRKHSSTLTSALGDDKDDPRRRRQLMNVITTDGEIRKVLEEHNLTTQILFDLAFVQDLIDSNLEGEEMMYPDPNLIKVVTEASALLVEVVRDVFKGRQEKRRAKEAAESEKAAEPQPTVTPSATTLPIDQPDELVTILRNIDLASQRMKIEELSETVKQLEIHRSHLNKLETERTKAELDPSHRTRMAIDADIEGVTQKIQDKSLSLKRQLEELTGHRIELPGLE